MGIMEEKMETTTWAPTVSKIMALMAILRGLGPLFYILLAFRFFKFRKYW